MRLATFRKGKSKIFAKMVKISMTLDMMNVGDKKSEALKRLRRDLSLSSSVLNAADVFLFLCGLEADVALLAVAVARWRRAAVPLVLADAFGTVSSIISEN